MCSIHADASSQVGRANIERRASGLNWWIPTSAPAWDVIADEVRCRGIDWLTFFCLGAGLLEIGATDAALFARRIDPFSERSRSNFTRHSLKVASATYNNQQLYNSKR